MRVVVAVAFVAVFVLIALFGGHYTLTSAADMEGSVGSAAQATCGWCHAGYSGSGAEGS
jgi:hypothetical protein